MNLRAIGEYATYYGFDIHKQEERLFAMNVLGLASSPTDASKALAMAQLVRIRTDVLGTTAVLGMLKPTLFELGTAQQVREHVRQTLTAYAGCPRFIIGPGCALPVDTKIENLAVLMDEVSK